MAQLSFAQVLILRESLRAKQKSHGQTLLSYIQEQELFEPSFRDDLSKETPEKVRRECVAMSVWARLYESIARPQDVTLLGRLIALTAFHTKYEKNKASSNFLKSKKSYFYFE